MKSRLTRGFRFANLQSSKRGNPTYHDIDSSFSHLLMLLLAHLVSLWGNTCVTVKRSSPTPEKRQASYVWSATNFFSSFSNDIVIFCTARHWQEHQSAVFNSGAPIGFQFNFFIAIDLSQWRSATVFASLPFIRPTHFFYCCCCYIWSSDSLSSAAIVLSGKVPLGLEGDVRSSVAVVNRGQIPGGSCETPTAWQMPELLHKVIKWPPNWYESVQWCNHSVTPEDVADSDPPGNSNHIL